MICKSISNLKAILFVTFFIICSFINAQSSIAGKTFKGNAFSETQKIKYECTLIIDGVNDDGTFTGQITWHSLNAIHKISGRVDGYTVIFREIEFIKKGKAVLDCDYALIYDGRNLAGRWISREPKDYGTFEVVRK
jgi:hypothetical protein